MLPGGTHIICMRWDMFPGLDLYFTDPAQYLITAGQDLNDLDSDLNRSCFLCILSTSTRIQHREQQTAP